MGGPEKWLRRLRISQSASSRETNEIAKTYDTAEWRDTDPDVILSYDPERPRPIITLPLFCLLMAGFLFAKGVLIAWHGPDIYHASIQHLETGTGLQRIGAFVMRPDAVSEFLAQQIRAPVF